MKPKILSAGHLHGDVIIKHAFSEEYKELVAVLESIDIPLRASGPFTIGKRPDTPKRQRKPFKGEKKFALMPVDQVAWNEQINKRLVYAGWHPQPLAAEPNHATGIKNRESKLKGDFVKNRVFVEVEFGNVASMYRDFFKFQIASRARTGDVAVLVTATQRLAAMFDQGITTYESLCSVRQYLSIGIQMPIWIVGLDASNWDEIELRYNEMFQVCDENDVKCHTFETVMRMATSDEGSEI